MSRSNSNKFRDLKASFDIRSKPTVATAASTAYRSTAGDLANMSSTKPASRSVPNIAKSIDSVLDTTAARQIVRPLAKLRPTWIGPPRPERPATPGVPIMKQHVIIEYSSPGLQPPVYIFTSLSDPQWDGIEMQSKNEGVGEYVFSAAFDVEEGEYQYKFRLGPGDWWVCDEDKPTVDDGSGNKNNLLVVKAQPKREDDRASGETKSIAVRDLQTTSKAQTVTTPKLGLQTNAAPTPAHEELSAPIPLMKHETLILNPNKISPFDVDDDEDPQLTSWGEGDSDVDGQLSSPLLRHESLAPSSVEQEHSPLFRHESIALGYNHHEEPIIASTPSKAAKERHDSHNIPLELDIHDSTLERFPTDHVGIIEHIHRATINLAEDETLDDSDKLDSPTSQALSESSISVPSLPSVREADEEELEKIREVEEREFEKEEAEGEEVDPLRPVGRMTPPMTLQEPEDADFEPKIAQHHEKVEIEESVVIEIIDERTGWFEALLGKLGGRANVV